METNEIHQGKAIEKLLEKSGLSVTKFAERVGISREHVYRILKQDQIKPYLFEKIMMVYGQVEPVKDRAGEPRASYVKINEEDRKNMLREIEFLQQRMKDLEEIIKAKNEIIDSLHQGNKRD